VDIECPASINDVVQKKYGVQVDEHDVVFSGICQKCKT
jgi:Fe2+ or Zn2+ uptake regulation protein